MDRLLIFGLGYSGSAIARMAPGFAISATSRSGAPGTIPFDSADQSIAQATHILTTIAPDEHGDPVLTRYGAAIAAAPDLRWIGYLSSTVVYGNRDGAWVDEDTLPAPSQLRGQRRLDAERAWTRFAARCRVDIFRLAGIYGPGRSAFDDLRAGRARRMIKAGHQFGRIHRDDIAQAVVAAMRQAGEPHRGQDSERRDSDPTSAPHRPPLWPGSTGPSPSTGEAVQSPGQEMARSSRAMTGSDSPPFPFPDAAASIQNGQTVPGVRYFNLADDEPSESADVVTEAAALLGIAPPPPVAFADALPAMSPMARSFWAESRRVASRKTQAALGISWLYPTYREGLRAILAEEGADGRP